MAFTRTLTALRTEIREAGEVDNDYVSNATLTAWINRSIGRLYDLLVAADSDFYTKSGTITVVSGTGDYALPVDFYQLRGVDIQETDSDWHRMERLNWGDRNRLQNDGSVRRWTRYRLMNSRIYLRPIPTYAGTNILKVWYVPFLTELSLDADTHDFVNTWHDFVVVDCLLKHAIKEESAVAALQHERNEIVARINSLSDDRDVGEPDYVRDVLDENAEDYYPDYYHP